MTARHVHKAAASAVQEQFWLIHNLNPDRSGYNIPSLFSLVGDVNEEALQKSLEGILDRHEIFRTLFRSENGAVVQDIRPEATLGFVQHDLSGKEVDKDHELVKSLIQAEVDRPFDLAEGPLLRCLLIRLADDKRLLLIVMHHIITDLHSNELFARELSNSYNALVSAENDPFTASSGWQYAQYAESYRQWQTSEEYRHMLGSWQSSLSQRDGYLNLPFDERRPVVESFGGGACSFELSRDLVKKLKGLARQQGVNLFLLLLASYVVLLCRYCRQPEIIVGVPFTNRRKAELKDMLGCFVNILPVAVTVQPTMSFAELLQLLRKEMLTAHRRQEVTFKEIAGAVKDRRSVNYNPLFQVGFTFQPPMQLELDGIIVKAEPVRSSDIQLDLFPVLWEEGEWVSGSVEFNAELFRQETVSRFVEHWKVLLAGLGEGECGPVSQLPMLAKKERSIILERWNNTAEEYSQNCCLHTLFEKQVEKTPTAPALFVDELSLSYEELNSRANKLARYLRKQGVKPGSLVGVFMGRSLEMVVALYGILKAGGAYVPLDPSYPEERLLFMMEDADLTVILTQEHLQKGLPSSKVKTIFLDSQWHLVEQERNEPVKSEVKADDLAYVIYTSGSTGQPKGAMNQHDGICNRLFWMQDAFELTHRDKVLQKTPYSFDVSVWEFFWPLQVGAALVMAPPESHYDPAALVRLIEEFDITTIHFVPSMLHAFLDAPGIDRCQSLKRLICSGEALSRDLQQKVFDCLDTELYNLYGPTEAAVDVTCWHCQPGYDRTIVPIGKPIANTRIYIVDELLQPTPIGVPGELLIGGIQVGRGYLQRADLTAKNFIADSFSESPGDRLYKTGDLARFLPDGEIEYLGRMDHQVKLHGLRIELGEVEAAIAEYPGVKQVVASLVDMASGSKALAAYVVADSSQHLSEKEMAQEIKSYLAKKLPCYMIPAYVLTLDELPLTFSGKVDRTVLPLPAVIEKVVASAPVSGDKHEIELAQIWRQLLKHGKISLDDNFFDVGGNSLTAVVLISEINKVFHTEIPVVKLFQYPTIRSFAQFMSTEQELFSQEELLTSRSRRQRALLASRRKTRGGNQDK